MVQTTWNRLRPLFVLSGLVLLTSTAPAIDAQSQQARLPRLEPSACVFQQGPALAGSKIDCYWLVVAERRERADSREIRLAVSVIRAQKPSDAVPLVMLHGGPGGSGLRAYPTRAVLSTWGSGERDVVIYDQRGAGFSEPKLCPEYGSAIDEARVLPTAEGREQRRAQGVRACIASLRAQNVDPAAYNTRGNALDLIDLRKALGYTRWDVYGGSYGSRVAQEVMLRDGGAIRATLLLWPVVRGSAQQAEAGLSLQHAMERIFTQCASQPSCHEAFPDPRADFYGAFDDLNRNALIVPRGQTGTDTVQLDGARLVEIIHNQVLSRPARANQLPLLLHELHVGDRRRAATTFGAFVSPLDGPAEVDVVNPLIHCFDSYGPEFLAIRDSYNQKLPAPYTNDNLKECPLWQERFADAADRVPVRGDIPALILTAEFDDRTPTEHGRRIAAALRQAHVIELPGIGHGSVPPQQNRCVDGLIARFFHNPSAIPDVSCVAQMPRIQFVTAWRE